MDWLQVFAAFGIGTLVSSLVNFFITHSITQDSERRRWIRDNKLAAFSELADELLSLGLSQRREEGWNPFATYAKVSKVLLFLEDKQLGDRINKFVKDRIEWAAMMAQQDDLARTAEARNLYIQLQNDAQAVVNDLRRNLLGSETSGNYIPVWTPIYILTGVIVLTAFVIWLVNVLP